MSKSVCGKQVRLFDRRQIIFFKEIIILQDKKRLNDL